MKLLQTVALAIALTSFLGCASIPEPKTCAMIGGGLGAVGGAVGGYEYSKNHHDAEAVGVGIGVALASAGLGYLVCAVLQKEEAPPPPPPSPLPLAMPSPAPIIALPAANCW